MAAVPSAQQDVLAERRRQIEAEGYDEAHDAGHPASELAAAAGCYLLFADAWPREGDPPPQWPWEDAAWKPRNWRRDFVRGAALAIAAIEAGDRAEG
jgi:hypothetical protein